MAGLLHYRSRHPDRDCVQKLVLKSCSVMSNRCNSQRARKPAPKREDLQPAHPNLDSEGEEVPKTTDNQCRTMTDAEEASD